MRSPSPDDRRHDDRERNHTDNRMSYAAMMMQVGPTISDESDDDI